MEEKGYYSNPSFSQFIRVIVVIVSRFETPSYGKVQ